MLSFCKWFTDSLSNDVDVFLQLSISIFDKLGWLEFTEWGVECTSGDTECSRVRRLKESSAQHLNLNENLKNLSHCHVGINLKNLINLAIGLTPHRTLNLFLVLSVFALKISRNY